MKYAYYILFFLSSSIIAQETIETTLVKKTDLNVESIISIDNFGTIYYENNNVFYKKDASKTITYNNLQLGELFSANAFNPLKINLFYRDFNSVIILDNRLAEIFKIDFNAVQPYKNVSHITTGYDNTLWVFNLDNQQLELYDYKSNTTRALSLPIQSEVIDLKSNYNYCWILTTDYIYKYNYFGSLVSKIKNDGHTAITENNGTIFLKKENTLFRLQKESKNMIPINISNLLINQFFVTNETLYIYDSKILFEYQIKIN
ncbi:hypothetical protein [uncultured Algibacter sp.]|uniref:hypothetical protein n=1 Tax=uncultured Algibacter sp. TaxID=298659 RepID=UPI00260477FB|nr:hypothetical protein [uncultured Algibacter sp.]